MTSEQRDQPGLRVEPLAKAKMANVSTSLRDTLPPMSLTLYVSYRSRPALRSLTTGACLRADSVLDRAESHEDAMAERVSR